MPFATKIAVNIVLLAVAVLAARSVCDGKQRENLSPFKREKHQL